MNQRIRPKINYQKDKDTSSWSIGEAILIRVWEVVWCLFLRWTPKKLNFVRIALMRLFGAKIRGSAFVFSSARIFAPFNLEIHRGACIGPYANIYNLAKLTLGERSVISQETMICGGTHDLASKRMPLLVGEIDVGSDVFVGARAMILPGIVIGEGAVVGAGAVVTKDVEPWTVVGGNPAKFIKRRVLRDDTND